MSQKAILVTNATGKQGSAVVNALLNNVSLSDTKILASTRSSDSPSAQKIAAKSDRITLVKGHLDDASALLKSAIAANAGQPIWGVYSVQISMGSGVTSEGEIKQGTTLIDAAKTNGVKVFVYSSVDRGGDEKSWTTPTKIEHFRTKYEIEKYLKANAGEMTWTVLRPVAFMDNLAPGFQTKVFLAALHRTLGDKKKLQWVATADIGVFAAKAFAEPEKWNGKAVGLAGDELTYPEAVKKLEVKTWATWWFLGGLLMWAVPEMGTMVQWFGDEGYGADVAGLKKEHSGLMDMNAWLHKESGWKN